MGGFGVLWVVRALILVQLVNGVLSWGEEGHFTVCKIAEGYLTEYALTAVKELLPQSAGGDLANVCSWPDEIRRTNKSYSWSTALHFVNPPDNECNYNYSRDCHDSAGSTHRCVSGGIYNYTMQLKTGYQNSISVAKYNLTEALMFLSHFIGDIHQPMHVGFVGDAGGNGVKVQWHGESTNLHRVWDDLIIGSALETFYGSNLTVMIQSIQRNITDDNWANDVSSWKYCDNNFTACPDLYASESISLACNFGYKNATSGTNLEDDYFLSRLPVVEKRLAQGGIRLAATLNRIFAPQIKIADA